MLILMPQLNTSAKIRVAAVMILEDAGRDSQVNQIPATGLLIHLEIHTCICIMLTYMKLYAMSITIC